MTREDIIKLIPTALLTTLVTVAFAYVRTFFETKWVIFSIFFITANFAIYAGLIAYYKTESKHQETLDLLKAVREDLEGFKLAIKSQLKFTWIISSEQLQIVEKSKNKCTVIWILTEDPSDDTGTSPWVPVIQENLSNGIKYTYLCLNHKGIRGAINALKDVFRDFPESCNIVLVDQDEFEHFPYQHIVIYDPNNQSGEMDCYAEIKAPEKGCWLQLTKDERNYVINRASKLVNQSQKISSYN